MGTTDYTQTEAYMTPPGSSEAGGRNSEGGDSSCRRVGEVTGEGKDGAETSGAGGEACSS